MRGNDRNPIASIKMLPQFTTIVFINTNNEPLEPGIYGSTLPLGFKVHPAFNQDTDSSGNPLAGIWVSKYKPSQK